MDSTLNINSQDTSQYASGISEASEYFSSTPSISYDDETTIPLNETVKGVYSQSRSACALFGNLLDKEAANIEKLGFEFDAYDQMLTDMVNAGIAST
ncbi:MAG: TIGR04197 family type VII secretion effector [Lachnospiraceae bacterium]|nr:TIGR04197 family type VII secretion effector [Lachnospiraceae bacterium]